MWSMSAMSQALDRYIFISYPLANNPAGLGRENWPHSAGEKPEEGNVAKSIQKIHHKSKLEISWVWYFPSGMTAQVGREQPPMQFGSAIKGLISLIIFFYAVLTKSSREFYTFYKRKIEIQENTFFPSASELDLRPRWGLMKLWKGEATLIKIINPVFYLFLKNFLSSDSFYF